MWWEKSISKNLLWKNRFVDATNKFFSKNSKKTKLPILSKRPHLYMFQNIVTDLTWGMTKRCSFLEEYVLVEDYVVFRGGCGWCQSSKGEFFTEGRGSYWCWFASVQDHIFLRKGLGRWWHEISPRNAVLFQSLETTFVCRKRQKLHQQKVVTLWWLIQVKTPISLHSVRIVMFERKLIFINPLRTHQFPYKFASRGVFAITFLLFKTCMTTCTFLERYFDREAYSVKKN